jgi:uncharacterized protein
MKRKLLTRPYMLLALLALALVVAACGQAEPPAQPTAAPKTAAPTAAPAAPTAAPKTAAPTAAPAAATPATKAPAAATPATKAPAAATPATKAPAAAATPAVALKAPPAATPNLAQDFRMSMATGGTAGTYYPFGGAIASLWSNNIPRVSVNVETSGASVENMRLLESRQIDLAITQNDIADYAYNATEMFQGKNRIESVRAIASLYPELVQWTVTPDIRTAQDLRGKRFVVGPAASGSEANTRQIFDALGMSYQDLGSVLYLSIAESAAAFKDRQVSGWATTGGVPNPGITDVATTREINMISFDDEATRRIVEKYPFFVQATVPAGAYQHITSPVNTVAVQASMVTRADLSEDVVYWLTRTLLEMQPQLAQAHAKGRELSKEAAAMGQSIPFHPGAERYYREIGVMR